MNYHKVLKKVEDQVRLFYLEHADPRRYYHTYYHIKEVVSAGSKMADHYQLDDRSRFIISAACCFHAAGYLITNAGSAEQKSAELAEKFLSTAGALQEDIVEIKKCIVVTKMPQKLVTQVEKIVCDASMFFFGTPEYSEKNKLLKKETEAFENRRISGKEWRAESIKMLESHRYHTDYCQSHLDIAKAEHLNALKIKQKERLFKFAAADTPENNIAGESGDNGFIGMNNETASARKKRPSRGIETMFRISSNNSMRISEMADAKAHIMISVNSIIFSVVLGLLVQKLDANKYLIIPTIILLAVNVTTIIYAVLATRPKITEGVFTREQVEEKSVNLIFFGNFYKMDFEEYDFGVTQMMEDRDFLYRSLRKDIYGQGKVLGRKYRLLHTSYTVFMYGIVVSVIAYAIAVLFEVAM